ncbi:DNA-processing protein DprA [Lysobacter sp. MMG2]|uniref:DNA-processing protein DprA n=1 Tax=Lysobacter sp. MMG2 TaxID=2801338 RepID=UPI001C24923C|nr:DNA-processing protein DprA [Lysobacter sp. MMG2]MBU8976925.1 DNA-processing protein DprA [Lysobacter sp. MMG2]
MTAPSQEESAALLRLIAAGGSLEARRALIKRHGGVAAALAAGRDAWRAAGLTDEHVAQLSQTTPPPRAVAWLQAPQHHLIGWLDPDYPPLLRGSPSPPLALFVAGDPALLWHPSVALVGSRAPTPGGRDNARGFARALAASGFAVTSGLAAGIDTAAHLATLEADGRTVAVLGTGVDVPYPRSNAALHARIVEHGAVVSEYLPGTGPVAFHFPSRNRILAGLALGTVVVEAAERSGALITARLAAEAGRDVFALPGSIHNPLARGCHRLIRDGAGLVESAGEVVAALAPQAASLARDLRLRLDAPIHPVHEVPAGARAGPGNKDPDYQLLWKALGHDPTAMDQLVERTGLTAAAVSSMLLLMELDGRVFSQHGRYFRSR